MNLSTIKPFFIQSEAIQDCGEDSGFVGNYENGLVVTGVFDGCGGIGGKRYPEVNGRTGAYIGSQTAAFAADTFFKKFGEKFRKVKNQNEQLQLFRQLQENISGKLANVKKKLAQNGGVQVGGSLSKSLPTTVCITTAISADEITLCNFLWAGDSRGYILDDNGLCQITVDDIDKNSDDAFLNLREDGILTNVANGDRTFTLHNELLFIKNDDSQKSSKPFMIINATDGCFAYFLTPMDFENVILRTMIEASTPAQWMNHLKKEIKTVTGDDFTLAVSCFGFESFDDMKKYYNMRQIYVHEKYIRHQDGADEEKLKQLWDDYKQSYYNIDRFRKIR